LEVDALLNLWPLLVGLIAAGVAGGLLAGLLGVGGGIVIVPVLFTVFGFLDVSAEIRMHLAIGTSFATMIPTALSSARAHYKKGAVDTTILRYWGPAAFTGCVLGVFVAGRVTGEILSLVFAAGALLVASYMLFSRDNSESSRSMPGPAISVASGGTIGFTSAMMGIGGGTFFVPLFTALGRPVHIAVGTSAALGIAISIPGFLGYVWTGWGLSALPELSFGFVNLIGALIVTPISTLVAPVGAKIAHRLQPRILKLAFGLFLLATAARMLSSFL
jgi:uncharacterized protein